MFCKLLNEEGSYVNITTNESVTVLFAYNFVASPDYTIEVDLKDTYQYPVDGWYWFDSEVEMMEFFNISKVE